jgi:hypothetical protein
MAIAGPVLDSHRIYNYRTKVIRTVAMTRVSASGLARLLCVYLNSVWGKSRFVSDSGARPQTGNGFRRLSCQGHSGAGDASNQRPLFVKV